MGVILLTVCRDTPTSVGFPSSEDVFTAKQELKGSMNPVTEQQITKTPVKADTAPEKKLTLKENLFQNVLSNPYIWLLAFTYFCIYIVRQGMNSWTVFYLIDAKVIQPTCLLYLFQPTCQPHTYSNSITCLHSSELQ
eukprot:scaffold508_cov554-Prasinococcus_capsulatus_cf.AAC.5